jgi:hypothetical protein
VSSKLIKFPRISLKLISDIVCFFQRRYYLQETITLAMTEFKFYCTTHVHDNKVGESVRNSPGSLTGRQDSLSQAG